MQANKADSTSAIVVTATKGGETGTYELRVGTLMQ